MKHKTPSLFFTILDQINTLGPTKSPPEVTALEVQVETHTKPKTFPQKDQAQIVVISPMYLQPKEWRRFGFQPTLDSYEYEYDAIC